MGGLTPLGWVKPGFGWWVVVSYLTLSDSLIKREALSAAVYPGVRCLAVGFCLCFFCVWLCCRVWDHRLACMGFGLLDLRGNLIGCGAGFLPFPTEIWRKEGGTWLTRRKPGGVLSTSPELSGWRFHPLSLPRKQWGVRIWPAVQVAAGRLMVPGVPAVRQDAEPSAFGPLRQRLARGGNLGGRVKTGVGLRLTPGLCLGIGSLRADPSGRWIVSVRLRGLCLTLFLDQTVVGDRSGEGGNEYGVGDCFL